VYWGTSTGGTRCRIPIAPPRASAIWRTARDGVTSTALYSIPTLPTGWPPAEGARGPDACRRLGTHGESFSGIAAIA
jgi:hypothetical protein